MASHAISHPASSASRDVVGCRVAFASRRCRKGLCELPGSWGRDVRGFLFKVRGAFVAFSIVVRGEENWWPNRDLYNCTDCGVEQMQAIGN